MSLLKRSIGSLSFRADFQPSTLDEEKRTVELVWSVGARGLRSTWWESYYEELSMDPAHCKIDRLNNGAPLLAVHEGYSLDSVIGVVERAWIKDGKGYAVVRFAKDEDSEKNFQKVKDGILRNISCGYRVYKYEKLEDGESTIPVYRATDWEVFEISIVPMGFDDSAKVRSAGPKDTYECEFIMARKVNQTITEESNMPKIDTNPAELNRASGEVNTNPTPAPAPTVDVEQVKRDAAKAEKQRGADIRLACRKAGLDEAFATSLVDSDKTIDQARAAIIDKVAELKEQDQPETRSQVKVTRDGDDKWREGASAWLVQRSGVGQIVEQHSKSKLDSGEFRGMSMVDLAREALERAGVKTRGMEKMTLVGKALTHRAYQSASDFGTLLEVSLHKVLLAAYGTTPDTWSRFCARGSVSDFRAHNRYRQGTFGRLEKVLENGEFRNKVIPDAVKESITAETYGNIIALSRQAIINDDMGAFNSLATRLGRAAKLSVEVDVYAALASNSGMGPTMSDGNTLFHATHNNVGTGAALSVDSLDADRVVLASQKDPSGNEILALQSHVLVLPVGLGGNARVINDAQYDPDTSNKLQKPNKVRGLFRDIVDSPRLSGTRRYLFADPSIAPCLEVAFLDGQDMPFMESQDGFKVDGVEWKVRLDYGVGGVDYRGAVTNAGA